MDNNQVSQCHSDNIDHLIGVIEKRYAVMRISKENWTISAASMNCPNWKQELYNLRKKAETKHGC